MSAAPDFGPHGVSAHWRDDWQERRPTPSQRLNEVTMAALSRPHAEPESMVEVSRNAKGDFQFTVTVRGSDVQACETLALGVVSRLVAQYPRGNGGET